MDFRLSYLKFQKNKSGYVLDELLPTPPTQIAEASSTLIDGFPDSISTFRQMKDTVRGCRQIVRFESNFAKIERGVH